MGSPPHPPHAPYLGHAGGGHGKGPDRKAPEAGMLPAGLRRRKKFGIEEMCRILWVFVLIRWCCCGGKAPRMGLPMCCTCKALACPRSCNCDDCMECIVAAYVRLGTPLMCITVRSVATLGIEQCARVGQGPAHAEHE